MSETPMKTASQFIDGLQVSSMFSVDLFRSAMQYKPRPGDIFVATYPKCGTTWAQHILMLIFRQGKPIESIISFMMETPYIELIGAKGAEIMARPGAIKTHLPYHLAPKSEEAKYIYVARNPKDCCVSYYHHMKNTPGHGFSGTFDQFFELFISGRIDYGDYFDHLLGWYEHRNDSNILFMTYEEMKENPEAAVLKMASFLDEEKFEKPLKDDPEKLNNVLKYSSFNHMKEFFKESWDQMSGFSEEDVLKFDFPDEIKQAFVIYQAMLKDSTPSTEKELFSPLVRKGIIGDWKNYFSEDQSKRMDQKFVERLEGTELQNIWKNYM